MNKQLKSVVKYLCKELSSHREAGYHTNYDIATDVLAQDSEAGFDAAYDVARYETLLELKNVIRDVLKEGN